MNCKINSLQNVVGQQCVYICAYIGVYTLVHSSVCVCVWCINAKSTQLKISLRDITYTRRATLNENYHLNAASILLQVFV